MKEDRYFLETPPLEFISDLSAIMQGGDNLSPEALVKDVSRLIEDYRTKHPGGVAYQAYELCQAIESLGASVELTNLVIKAGEVTREVSRITLGDPSRVA